MYQALYTIIASALASIFTMGDAVTFFTLGRIYAAVTFILYIQIEPSSSISETKKSFNVIRRRNMRGASAARRFIL